MRLLRVALMIVGLLIAASAEAIPVQMHVFVELASEGHYPDVLGLDGATLEIVYEIHDEGGGERGVRTGAQGRGAWVIVTGSTNRDGAYTGFPFWSLTNSTPAASSMGIHDLTTVIGDWSLWFVGGFYAYLPPGFSVPSGEQGGGLPFEFNTAHVTQWIAGNDGVEARGPRDPVTGSFALATYSYLNPRGYATAVGVPEPTTLLLLVLGAIGLRLRRK